MYRPPARLGPLLLAACLLSPGGCGKSGPGQTPVRSASGQEAVDRAALTNPTLAYWIEVNRAFYRFGPDTRNPAGAAARAWRAMAARVQGLPTRGVSPAVVRWALAAAAVCERFAAYLEYDAGGGLVLEAVIRGANGDPFGTAADAAAAEQALRAEYLAVREEGMRLRAEATTHYGVEFPRCTFLEGGRP